jgi:hypothetical protein
MNINKHQQRGMSFSSIAFIIFILIFSLWIFFQLFPIYVENWKIVDALEKIKEQQKVDQRTDHEIRQIFLTILSEKKVEGFDNENLKQHLTVVRRSDEGIVEITLKYQRTEPLTGNISFLLDFENYIEAP